MQSTNLHLTSKAYKLCQFIIIKINNNFKIMKPKNIFVLFTYACMCNKKNSTRFENESSD